MRVHLQYGIDGIGVEIPSANVTVVQPVFVEGLPDEAAAFAAAVRAPIESQPLRELIRTSDRVAIVIPDVTRPLPTARLLPWVLSELSHVPARNITIINGTGSHRENTREELVAMVGAEVMTRVRVVNHTAHDTARLAFAGKTTDGRRILLNREYVAADRRIVLGFIEPHFMAGFSGGYKGIFPALADIDSIMHYHRASVIGDSGSTWGLLEGNPTQEQIRANGSVLPVDFCINVTLNRHRAITGFYCGDPLAAHRRGCEFAKATAMVRCERDFPVVITTNGGYPLDQNLYQAVKGMSAGAQIVEKDGFILAAARCNDGFPAHGNFRKLLFEHRSPQAILDTITAPGFSLYDQWEAQVLALILLKARVGLYSDMPVDEVRCAHLEPVSEISRRIAEELESAGRDATIAVLPEGPMTIPYLPGAVDAMGPREGSRVQTSNPWP
ncbi:MAG TPA: nickel-dependent lactate racemase [Acidobacteriota bacterium]|nr:nickel-dependent lactate racemase [Acidobacteriota bacterium]